jgi:DNA-binding CsgD family transcriptional regulator
LRSASQSITSGFGLLDHTMSHGTELIALIDSIYEAVLDSRLWSSVLVRLADTMGAAHIAMPSINWREHTVATIAPRCDPGLLQSWQKYWVFHDPVLLQATLHPVGKIYTIDSFMPREEFAATPVFNEFWRPAKLSLSAAAANLLVEDRFSALIFFSNAPGKDFPTSQQMHFFEAALRHLIRAVRMSRLLWELELAHVAEAERLDFLRGGALIVDALGRVVRANTASRAMLDEGSGIFLDKGRLATAGHDILQKLIGSCARASPSLDGPGGEFKIPREPPRSPLHVMVAPLRSNSRLADVPWIGVGTPVAIVTVRDPDLDRLRQEVNLRRRFGLTAGEAKLASEILKGDGRAAAARRHGITPATAKTYLSSIFEKTGTHRQAELVRLLLEVADEQEIKT